MFVTFITISSLVKFDHYRDTRAAILDPCIQGIFKKNCIVLMLSFELKVEEGFLLKLPAKFEIPVWTYLETIAPVFLHHLVFTHAYLVCMWH